MAHPLLSHQPQRQLHIRFLPASPSPWYTATTSLLLNPLHPFTGIPCLMQQTSMQEVAQGELANARTQATSNNINNNIEEDDNMEDGSGDGQDADHRPRKKHTIATPLNKSKNSNRQYIYIYTSRPLQSSNSTIKSCNLRFFSRFLVGHSKSWIFLVC